MIRNGSAGEIIGRVIDIIKPESIYFSEIDGNRDAVMVVDVKDASSIHLLQSPGF